MISAIRSFGGHFRSQFTWQRFKHKYVFNMDKKVYLRHLEEEQKFEISFQYVDPALRIDRQFNFCRQLSETVEAFSKRVATNVEKVIAKKKKLKSLAEPLKVSLYLECKEVADASNLQCAELFKNVHNKVVLKIGGQEFDVVLNSPWIGSLALPSSIMANFVVYPSKFETVNTDKKLSEFAWFKSKDKNNWIQIGQKFYYETKNEDVGHYLKFVCTPVSQDEVQGPSFEAITGALVEASPGICPFENRHKFTTEYCKGQTFRVVTYNILADLYCDADYTREVLHPYCPPYALHIDYRKQLIIKELFGYNADIICLQEVDRKVYNYDLKILFEDLGYDSDFCQKRGECAEGLACIFRSDKFRKLASERLVLSDEINKTQIYANIWSEIEKNPQLIKRVLDRTTVLQVNVLECLEKECENEILVVANTHLYFHPDADHIRLLQGGYVIKYLENYMHELKIRLGASKRVSLVLCGDFNSTPECGIYQLFTTGIVSSDHIDFKSNAEQAVTGVNLEQAIALQSACGTPKFTNFTAGFAACLDYIFYESTNLEVVQVIPLPSDEELGQHTALPSVLFPSDHVSLVSDLKFKSGKTDDEKVFLLIFMRTILDRICTLNHFDESPDTSPQSSL